MGEAANGGGRAAKGVRRIKRKYEARRREGIDYELFTPNLLCDAAHSLPLTAPQVVEGRRPLPTSSL